MVRKIFILILLPTYAFSFDDSYIGRTIKGLYEVPNRGLSEGSLHTIVSIISARHAVLDTGGTINSIHEGIQWEYTSSDSSLPDTPNTTTIELTRYYYMQHKQLANETSGGSENIYYLISAQVDYTVGIAYTDSLIQTINIAISNVTIDDALVTENPFIASIQGYPSMSWQIDSLSLQTGVSVNTSTGLQREIFTFTDTNYGQQRMVSFPIVLTVGYSSFRDPSGLNRSFSPSFNFTTNVSEIFIVNPTS